MKFFEIKKADGDTRFCQPSVNPESEWINERLSSNIYKNIYELPIPYLVENKYKPDDYLVSKNNIFSKKAFNIMKSLNKNLTEFESQMYFNGEKIWDIYYTLLFPKYKLFNWEKSIYETMKSRVDNSINITWLDKLVFDSKKIQNITEDNFFTMEESPVGIYCTELGKQAIEEAGLIGFAFEEIPVE